MRQVTVHAWAILFCMANLFAAPRATVVATKGVFTVTRAQVSVPAQVYMALEESDVLATGQRSAGEVLLDNGALIKLDADTTVTLEKLLASSEQEDIQIGLSMGRVFASVRKRSAPSASFIVRTRTSVAAVRGTEYVVEASPDATDIGVFDGAVAVSALDAGDDTTVLVTPGKQTTVPARGGPLPAFVMNARMRSYQSRMEQLRQRAEMYRRSLDRVLRKREETALRMQRYWDRRLQQLQRK